MATQTIPVLNQPTVTNGVGFRHSETFAKLAEALSKAQREFTTVKKDTTNPYYNAKYAPLDSIIEACQPALAKNGLVVIQSPRTEGKSVTITTLLAHVSGEWIADDLTLPAEGKGKDGALKFDPQTVGSAITYGRRYAYQSLVGIAAEEDDDANTFVQPPSRKTASATLNVPQTLEEARNPFISPFQISKFLAEARRTGKTDAQIKNYLGSEGFESASEMFKKDFQKHLDWASAK